MFVGFKVYKNPYRKLQISNSEMLTWKVDSIHLYTITLSVNSRKLTLYAVKFLLLKKLSKLLWFFIIYFSPKRNKLRKFPNIKAFISIIIPNNNKYITI